MEETAKFVLVLLVLLPPFPFRIFFFRQLFPPPPLLPTSRSHSWRPKLLLPPFLPFVAIFSPFFRRCQEATQVEQKRGGRDGGKRMGVEERKVQKMEKFFSRVREKTGLEAWNVGSQCVHSKIHVIKGRGREKTFSFSRP